MKIEQTRRPMGNLSTFLLYLLVALLQTAALGVCLWLNLIDKATQVDGKICFVNSTVPYQ
jgi:hypothetical protein